MCQVPGCGCHIKRPWNHICQGKLHGDLSSEDKRMYVDLTKSIGKQEDVPETEPPAAQVGVGAGEMSESPQVSRDKTAKELNQDSNMECLAWRDGRDIGDAEQ